MTVFNKSFKSLNWCLTVKKKNLSLSLVSPFFCNLSFFVLCSSISRCGHSLLTTWRQANINIFLLWRNRRKKETHQNPLLLLFWGKATSSTTSSSFLRFYIAPLMKRSLSLSLTWRKASSILLKINDLFLLKGGCDGMISVDTDRKRHCDLWASENPLFINSHIYCLLCCWGVGHVRPNKTHWSPMATIGPAC